MSYTLDETLRQIDRFVNLSDGHSVHRAGEWLAFVDLADPSEYILCVDSIGRLLIHRLDCAGYMIFPPAFVEEKQPDQKSSVGLSPQFDFRHPQNYV